MKAIVQDTYGSPDVLHLRDIDPPRIGPGEVLIRVHAAGVDPGAWHLMTGIPYLVRLAFGLRRPKNPVRGLDVAGVIEAVGAEVTAFRPGDEVFGVCGGSYAEFARASQEKVAPKPANLSFEQAAAVPVSATTALTGLRAAKVEAGHKVLVIGAGGGVGTFAVQLARIMGAEVTGVCSTSKVELVRSLGATHVIDYTREDFADAKYEPVPKPPRTALGAPGGSPQERRDEHSGSTRFEPDAPRNACVPGDLTSAGECPPPQPEGTAPGGRSAASAPLTYEPHKPAGPFFSVSPEAIHETKGNMRSIPPDVVAARGGLGTGSYDAILDIAGNRPLSHLRRALTPKGRLVLIGGEGGGRWFGMGPALWAMVASIFSRQTYRSVLAQVSAASLNLLKEHLEAGRLAPVIDRSYPLAEVPAAIRALAEGHSRGKAVIKVR